MVGMDKPLACLIVVSRLDVDKGQVIGYPFVTSCTTLKE